MPKHLNYSAPPPLLQQAVGQINKDGVNVYSSTSDICFKHETSSGLTSEVWTPGQSCWTRSPPRPPQLGPAPLQPLETLFNVLSFQPKLDLSIRIKTRNGGNRKDGFKINTSTTVKTDWFVSGTIPPIRSLKIIFFKDCPSESLKILFLKTVLQTKKNP